MKSFTSIVPGGGGGGGEHVREEGRERRRECMRGGVESTVSVHITCIYMCTCTV